MIELERVTKRYGSTAALRDVSFRAEKGIVTGLLGLNGAGKTTALNLMTGYFPPDEGRVLINGKDLLREPRECKRAIGYLPERPPIYDEMTVKDYLSFVCDLKEVAPRAKKAHIGEILEMCFLKDVGGRVCGHLSKGYRQRVGIAQALCGSPDILILDEPTVGLDPQQVTEIRTLIRRLSGEKTILFSSHLLSEVQQLCGTAVILHEGRVIRTLDLTGKDRGTVCLRMTVKGGQKEILQAVRSLSCVRTAEALTAEEPDSCEFVLACQRENEKGRAEEQIFRLLSAMDRPIRRLSRVEDSLEETFLRLTRTGQAEKEPS